MRFEPGVFIVAVTILIFYARLVQLRGRNRRLAREAELARIRTRGKRKKTDQPVADANTPSFRVGNWWLLGIGALFMLAGVAMRTGISLPPEVKPFWWIPTAVGVVVFTFSFR